MTTRREVTVVGAGLSGLATAWYLMDAGAAVHVIEAADRPGGLIQTAIEPHGLVEFAARAFIGGPRVGALFTAVGVTPIAPRKHSRRRYIYRSGSPRRWPLSPLESVAAGARFGMAWVCRDIRPNDDESVLIWGQRVFGRAATSWLLGPALQGIYASPPEDLSAAAIFGGVRRARGPMVAPAGGMGELIRALHTGLLHRGASFTFGTPVRSLDPNALTAICTSAPAAASLLAPLAPALSTAIAKIRMVRVRPVTAFYRCDVDDVRGFGVLFPRGSGIDALGVLFNADTFDGRSAVRSETWMYGGDAANGQLQSVDEWKTCVTRDRQTFTGRSADALAWNIGPASALPVYDRAVVRARLELHGLPSGIAVAGNYLGRLGVSALLDGAAEAAARLTALR